MAQEIVMADRRPGRDGQSTRQLYPRTAMPPAVSKSTPTAMTRPDGKPAEPSTHPQAPRQLPPSPGTPKTGSKPPAPHRTFPPTSTTPPGNASSGANQPQSRRIISPPPSGTLAPQNQTNRHHDHSHSLLPMGTNPRSAPQIQQHLPGVAREQPTRHNRANHPDQPNCRRRHRLCVCLPLGWVGLVVGQDVPLQLQESIRGDVCAGAPNRPSGCRAAPRHWRSVDRRRLRITKNYSTC